VDGKAIGTAITTRDSSRDRARCLHEYFGCRTTRILPYHAKHISRCTRTVLPPEYAYNIWSLMKPVRLVQCVLLLSTFVTMYFGHLIW
jgi:hypothetical protein